MEIERAKEKERKKKERKKKERKKERQRKRKKKCERERVRKKDSLSITVRKLWKVPTFLVLTPIKSYADRYLFSPDFLFVSEVHLSTI